MVIEINIRISDSDGKILHQFENRFDETEASFEAQENRNVADKDFENFLSEYLTYSGFTLRERLIKDTCHASNAQEESAMTICPDIYNEDPAGNNLEGSELEYKIRIGKNKVLIGRVPLTLQSTARNITSNQTDEEIETTFEIKHGNRRMFQKDLQDTQAVNDVRSESNEAASLKNEAAVIDTIINFAMVKAIEKYEANLYPAYYEPDNNLEPILEE